MHEVICGTHYIQTRSDTVHGNGRHTHADAHCLREINHVAVSR